MCDLSSLEHGDEASISVSAPRQVRLDSLQLGDACTARLSGLWADLGCTRCGERATLQLSGLSEEGATQKAWCDKCAVSTLMYMYMYI